VSAGSDISRRPLALAATLAVLITAVVLPVGVYQLDASATFVAAVVSVVACFDVLSVYLLIGDYRDRGDPRLLMMAWAYSWSLVVMGGYAFAFPGAVLQDPPLATTPSTAPYLYVAWHAGFPVLLGLAWAPWPARWTSPTAAGRRSAVARGTLAGAVLAGALVVGVLTAFARHLPTLINGVDTSAMTRLTAPLAIPAVVLALVAAVHGTWHRAGPERWSTVAILVCLCDLVLTYNSGTRYSLGWYCGRSLTLVAAGVVMVAMLSAFQRLKAQSERDAVALRSLAGIVAGARDAIYSTNRAHVVTSWNAAAAELYGYTAAERLGTPLSSGVPADRVAELHEWLARIEAGGRVDQAETVRRRKDGSLIEVSLTLSPVLDADNGVTGASITSRDITERRQAETDLRRQAIVFDRMNDMVVITDANRTIVDCNPAAERIMECTREELLERLPDAGTAAAQDRFGAVLRENDDAWNGDVEFTRVDGSAAVAELVTVPLHASDGSFTGMIMVGRDVTGARAASAALRQSEQRFTLAFTQAPIGVILTGMQAHNRGRILSANPAVCAMLDYPRDQLLRLTFVDITHPDDAASSREQVQRMLTSEKASVHFEKRYLRSDGSTIWVALSASVVRDDDGAPSYSVTHLQDITQRRADHERLALASADLAESNQALQRVNGELDRFTATVAHDLKTPITSIAGYAEILQDLALSDGEGMQARALRAVLENTDRMCTLIDGLLAYARASNEPLTLDTVDTAALVRDIAAELAPTLSRTGGWITIGKLPVVAAHTVLLRQVFSNIIGNAIKYVAPGVAPQIEVSAELVAGTWSFTITDNGIGIPVEARHRVFRMFHRETTNGFEGTGIGLTTCKRIIDRHGGTMQVSGRPERGATPREPGSVFQFTVAAPAPAPALAEARVPALAEAPSAALATTQPAHPRTPDDRARDRAPDQAASTP
jgi:PAS domain S-box-containing protein